MTPEQKKIVRTLLDLSYKHGFSGFDIELVAKEAELPVEGLIDLDTETGILWPFHPAADGPLAGLLYFQRFASRQGIYVGVSFDCKELLEHWSDWR